MLIARCPMLLLVPAVLLALGCTASPRHPRYTKTPSPAQVQADANQAGGQADEAIRQAEQAIRQADEIARLTAGVNAQAAGEAQLSDTQVYRRSAADLRNQAISYADLSNKARQLSNSVDDPRERTHWAEIADRCAGKSRKLHELADRYLALAQ